MKKVLICTMVLMMLAGCASKTNPITFAEDAYLAYQSEDIKAIVDDEFDEIKEVKYLKDGEEVKYDELIPGDKVTVQLTLLKGEEVFTGEIELVVKDDEAPVISITKDVFYVNEEVKYTDVIKVEDNYDENLAFTITTKDESLVEVSENIPTEKTGEYEITVKVVDAAGNETLKTITYEVVNSKEDADKVIANTNSDTSAPTISVTGQLQYKVGENVNVYNLFSVKDNTDKNPTVKVSGSHNSNKAGSYRYVVTATDKVGNKATKEFYVEFYPQCSNGQKLEGFKCVPTDSGNSGNTGNKPSESPKPSEPSEKPSEPTECEHNYVLIEEVPAKPGKAGYRVYECSKCGDTYREDIPALPVEPEEPEEKPEEHVHNYTVFERVEPQIGYDGYITYLCSCGHSYRETIPALEPNYLCDKEGVYDKMQACDVVINWDSRFIRFDDEASCKAHGQALLDETDTASQEDKDARPEYYAGMYVCAKHQYNDPSLGNVWGFSAVSLNGQSIYR